MSDKRCELCGKQPPSVHYTEIADSKMVKRFICRNCAEKRGLLDEPSKPALALQELLAPPATPKLPEPETESVPNLLCRNCGLSFAQFRKQGRLGCATCYVVFASELGPLLRKIHHHARHVGKAPRTYSRKSELREQARDLRQQLERAVRSEDYERAAGLRDQIRNVEEQQNAAARQAMRPEARPESPEEKETTS